MARQGKSREAVAYLRTSSAANIGADKDSDRRQREAIQGFARRAGIEVLDEFYDPAVSGGDPVESRPGFIAMLKRIEGNGVRTIIVETASRFARDLMVQEVGYAMLTERGIELIAADSPQSFIEDTPTARLIRQVLGAVSEFDKAMTVAKLRGARDRKRKDGATRTRRDGGAKVEGRKNHAELRPQVVAEAKRLRRKRPKGGQRSYRQIAAELFQAGYANSNGRAFSPRRSRPCSGDGRLLDSRHLAFEAGQLGSRRKAAASNFSGRQRRCPERADPYGSAHRCSPGRGRRRPGREHGRTGPGRQGVGPPALHRPLEARREHQLSKRFDEQHSRAAKRNNWLSRHVFWRHYMSSYELARFTSQGRKWKISL